MQDGTKCGWIYEWWTTCEVDMCVFVRFFGFFFFPSVTKKNEQIRVMENGQEKCGGWKREKVLIFLQIE